MLRPDLSRLALLFVLLLATSGMAKTPLLTPVKKRQKYPPRLLADSTLKLRLDYVKGAVKPGKPTRQKLAQRQLFRRFVGQYRIDVYAGKKRIEVVPFNFPMLGRIVPQNPDQEKLRRRIKKNLVTSTEVTIPFRSDGTHLLLVFPDRKRTIWIELPWQKRGPAPKPTSRPKTTPTKK